MSSEACIRCLLSRVLEVKVTCVRKLFRGPNRPGMCLALGLCRIQFPFPQSQVHPEPVSSRAKAAPEEWSRRAGLSSTRKTILASKW